MPKAQLERVQKQAMSEAAQEKSDSAMRAMLLMQRLAQSPLGMGTSWARAAPAKVAARTAKDFILTEVLLFWWRKVDVIEGYKELEADKSS